MPYFVYFVIYFQIFLVFFSQLCFTQIQIQILYFWNFIKYLSRI
jgi:hypothetical protein